MRREKGGFLAVLTEVETGVLSSSTTGSGEGVLGAEAASRDDERLPVAADVLEAGLLRLAGGMVKGRMQVA